MITQIDLRIKYRLDTGRSAIRVKDGYLKQEYMQWLEPNEPDRFRMRFKKDTGITPVLYDNSRTRWNRPAFDQEYGLWLEEVGCRVNNALAEIEKEFNNYEYKFR